MLSYLGETQQKKGLFPHKISVLSCYDIKPANFQPIQYSVNLRKLIEAPCLF